MQAKRRTSYLELQAKTRAAKADVGALGVQVDVSRGIAQKPDKPAPVYKFGRGGGSGGSRLSQHPKVPHKLRSPPRHLTVRKASIHLM